MINYLKGTIQFKNLKSITLNVNDVGYELFVSNNTLSKVKLGDKKDFFCYLKVSENAMELYGFETVEEKDFFELLLSVSGVGPKSALQTLSIAKINEIKAAILNSDASLLKNVSGIGQKTAERIVVELKNKIKDVILPNGKNISASSSSAFEALKGLGYSVSEIRETLKHIPNDITNEDEIIKFALKSLGKNK